jgi:hypothetical protein
MGTATFPCASYIPIRWTPRAGVIDEASGVQVLDVSADQWEEKRVKLEFVTGEGQREEVWAESFEQLR